MNKVTIKESDLKKIINKSLGKKLTESSIPEEVVDYVKKHPKLVIESMMKVHGERFFDLIGETYSNNKTLL